jgi:glycosyltransferase involved in cell wall biosynthesis
MLMAVFPRLLAQEPEAKLSVATYDYPGTEDLPFYREMRRLAAGFGDLVTWHQPLGKIPLYRLLASCGALVYPTPSPAMAGFAETSCLAILEALACGCQVVATDRGALPETLNGAGVLVPLNGAAHAGEGDVPVMMAEAALRVMRERLTGDLQPAA